MLTKTLDTGMYQEKSQHNIWFNGQSWWQRQFNMPDNNALQLWGGDSSTFV